MSALYSVQWTVGLFNQMSWSDMLLLKDTQSLFPFSPHLRLAATGSNYLNCAWCFASVYFRQTPLLIQQLNVPRQIQETQIRIQQQQAPSSVNHWANNSQRGRWEWPVTEPVATSSNKLCCRADSWTIEECLASLPTTYHFPHVLHQAGISHRFFSSSIVAVLALLNPIPNAE